MEFETLRKRSKKEKVILKGVYSAAEKILQTLFSLKFRRELQIVGLKRGNE